MKAGNFLIVTALNFSLAMPASAQAPASPPASQPSAQGATPTPGASSAKTFSQQELDQLLAPVALYPDELLAQVLMASTYPLDVVMADRWVKANPKLKGKELEDALQKQPWDPSVKSLVVVPQVLTMMSEKVDWTQKLGDAFLAQQKEVMATAQALRKKAVDQGSLKDSKEQKISTEQTGSTTVIKIEPTNPEVVYVPTYNPTVVYGSWPYPAYPPYYYYPPGYVPGAAFFSFTAGAIVGAALWGGCNWNSGSVNVNVNRYNNFNRSNISSGNWNHNAARRGAVPYRDQRVAQQYGRGQSANAASREQFRGRTSTQAGSVGGDFGGRDAGNRSGVGDRGGRDTSGVGDRGGRDTGGIGDRGDRGGRDAGDRSGVGDRNAGGRDVGGTRNATAFDTGRGGQTRDFSDRGSSSLNSARSSGNFSGGGASRSSGGFSGGGGRGGGGFGGGGGRGGGRR